jgi:two-component system chemotaxis sensor kinase CheA
VAEDPYRYFRIESEELVGGLAQGTLELERGGDASDGVRRMLRLAHTLKGAARVVKLPEIGDHAHTIEDLLTPYRGAPPDAPVPKATVDTLLAELDRIRALLARLEPASPVAASRPSASASTGSEQTAGASDDIFRSVRVDLAELDAVLQTTARLGIVAERLGAAAAALEPLAGDPERRAQREALRAVRVSPSLVELDRERLRRETGGSRRALGRDGEELGREVAELREQIQKLRLLPAEMLFADLQRVARDAAVSTGKQVEFRTHGASIRIDAHVLAAIRGALLHVVRNAIAHGIEEPALRAARGKKEAGLVSFTVARRGYRAVFTCVDDGGGIDEAAIESAARKHGLVAADAGRALEQHEVIELLLQGGVSTSDRVTNLAGRGIGLEVVNDTLKRLKGDVAISSTAGVGTTVELAVPISLASMPMLAVRAGDTSVLIPLDVVRETVRLDASDRYFASGRESLVWREQPIPLMALAPLVGATALAEHTPPRSAVIVRASRGDRALAVDQVLAVRDVVVQPLPSSAVASALVGGIALDASGMPNLVMAPSELDQLVGDGAQTPLRAPQPQRLPVLVIDDSLTTRMLEQTILEAAGYEVDLATSAEEGLEKAARRRYGLFIVDVEMPGMTGFEFVAQTRGNPEFRDIPAILVTSRNAPEDYAQGQAAGAAAYFAKSEFNQEALLARIRELMRSAA